MVKSLDFIEYSIGQFDEINNTQNVSIIELFFDKLENGPIIVAIVKISTNPNPHK